MKRSGFKRKRPESDPDWQIARAKQLVAVPYCEVEHKLWTECWAGLDVHHVYPQARRWGDHSELMTMCRGHHQLVHENGRAHAREQGWIKSVHKDGSL